MSSRAVLHPDGADPFETLLAKVTALCEQVHSASLEVLILVQVQLQNRRLGQLPSFVLR